MWAAIVILVIALLLVLTAPKPKIENARAANLGDFNFPRSKEGDPCAWFLGTVRMRSPNTLWNGDYTPYPIKKKQSTGLFSSKKVIVGYQYYIGLDLCWCLGGDNTATLRRLWSDKYVFWSGAISTPQTITINNPNLFGGIEQRGGLVGRIDFYPGSFNETRSAYLAAKADPEVPAYIGQTRTVFKGAIPTTMAIPSGFYFGTTTNINAISAELSRYSSNVSEDFSIMSNGFDVNPMEFMYSAFTQKFGMPGLSPEDIDLPSWQACAEQLYNENMGMSLLVQTSVTGKDLAEEALRIADGILYQDNDTGKIVARLIRSDYVLEELDHLDETIIKELVNFTKTTWDQAYNQCRVTFKDRAADYVDRVAMAQDFALINFQSKVRNTDISMPGCFVNDSANELAVRQLSLLSVPLFQIEIRCNRRAAKYKPGDVFIFDWAPYGLSNMPMRIQKIDKGTLTDGVVTINAVQDRFATAQPVFAPPTGSGWVNPIQPPMALSRPAIFELPFQLFQDTRAFFGSLGSQQQAIDTSYITHYGPSGGTIVEKGEVLDFTPTATLTNAYAANTAARHVAGFAVSSVLGASFVPASVTEDELLTGASIALIRSASGDELIAFKFFDGVQVADVIRGVYGSVPLDHAAGSIIYFLSSGMGLLNEEDGIATSGASIFAKLQTANSLGRFAYADVPTLSAAVINKALRPDVPGRVRVAGAIVGAGTVTGVFTLSWAHRNATLGIVLTQDDVSVAPLDDTRYNIRAYNGATLLAQAVNAKASSAVCQFAFTGVVRFELEAVNAAALTSYNKQRFQINYNVGTVVASSIVPDTDDTIFDGGHV